MRRRWFFRVLTLTLLLLCLGVWGWSCFLIEQVAYVRDSTSSAVRLIAGGLILSHYDGRFSDTGWHQFRADLWPGSDWPADAGSGRYLGFQVRGAPYRFLRIPLWFPTLLLAALTAWAWRKRRSEGGRGFAVGQGEGEHGMMNDER